MAVTADARCSMATYGRAWNLPRRLDRKRPVAATSDLGCDPGSWFDGYLRQGMNPPYRRHGFTGAATAGARPINGYLRQGMKASRVAWEPGLGPVEWAQANRQLPW